MERRDDLPDRLPLPSEDEGDLAEEPANGETEDPMVASQEGVPWVPPTERVVGPRRSERGGADLAGAPASDEEELEAEGRPADGLELPRDEALLSLALDALRSSDLTAGDRVRIDAAGSTIWVRGRVESVEISEEIVSLLGDLPGVSEVVDELEIEAG